MAMAINTDTHISKSLKNDEQIVISQWNLNLMCIPSINKIKQFFNSINSFPDLLINIFIMELWLVCSQDFKKKSNNPDDIKQKESFCRLFNKKNKTCLHIVLKSLGDTKSTTESCAIQYFSTLKKWILKFNGFLQRYISYRTQLSGKSIFIILLYLSLLISESCPEYTWNQNAEDVNIQFTVPEGTKKSDIYMTLTHNKVNFGIKNGKVLLEGMLHGFVDVDGSTWIMEKQM